MIRLKRPPKVFPTCTAPPNHFRFRVSPDVVIALGATVMDPAERAVGAGVELTMSHHPGANEPDAYERVLGDAMDGDQTLFAREDYVEEAWRIVDPVLAAGTPLYPYEPGQWGPAEARRIAPKDGWDDPLVAA
jgi:glucose-6-phosphate 1-dehydrogenase